MALGRAVTLKRIVIFFIHCIVLKWYEHVQWREFVQEFVQDHLTADGLANVELTI